MVNNQDITKYLRADYDPSGIAMFWFELKTQSTQATPHL